jgi:hypothetical protein
LKEKGKNERVERKKERKEGKGRGWAPKPGHADYQWSFWFG